MCSKLFLIHIHENTFSFLFKTNFFKKRIQVLIWAKTAAFTQSLKTKMIFSVIFCVFCFTDFFLFKKIKQKHLTENILLWRTDFLYIGQILDTQCVLKTLLKRGIKVSVYLFHTISIVTENWWEFLNKYCWKIQNILTKIFNFFQTYRQ